ncbi:MAG: DUF3987 domain-containing protein [Acidobacteria bacterium]|nr:DUF3987 domain-containing protein [Acidobacteriota bacterium]
MQHSPTRVSVDTILNRLEGVKESASGWRALCPAHEDRNPSLSLRVGGGGRLLLKCHAQCSLESVVAALGLTVNDLFPLNGNGARPGRRQRTEIGREFSPVAEDANLKNEARKRAKVLWQGASPAPNDHAYLLRKGIKAHGLRLNDGRLVIPLLDGEEIQSLQFIGLDGEKRFLTGGRITGCYFPIGKPDGSLCIAEGYATGASIYEATGCAVAVAFTAGNLLPVAQALRVKFSDLRLIVCADDDAKKPGNLGLTKAREAALAVAGLLAIPDFGDNRPEHATDFNDLHLHAGLEAVRGCIERAPALESNVSHDGASWPDPTPFQAPVKLPTFPVEALPEPLRTMVIDVALTRQVPVDLPAMLALSATALVASGSFEIRLNDAHSEPLNIYTLTALPSGERKSGTFRDMVAPLERAEKEMIEEAEPIIAEASQLRAIEDARLKNLRDKAAKTSDSAVRLQATEDAVKLAQSLTPVSALPRLLTDDVTPERLAGLLFEQNGRMGLFSAEGGIFEIINGRYSKNGKPNVEVLIKGHAGDTLIVDRMGRAEHVERPALTIGLSPQPWVVEDLGNNKTFRGRGLLNRFLYSFPESLVGTREYKDIAVNRTARDAYGQAIRELMTLTLAVRLEDRPATLCLSTDASLLWRVYAGEIERAQAPGKPLSGISGWASKLAGAVARIAGGFHLIEHRHGDPARVVITTEVILNAWAVGDYLKQHALAAFSMMGATPDVALAMAVLRWIQRRSLKEFSLRDSHRAHQGVNRVDELRIALEVLEERHYLRAKPLPSREGAGQPPSPMWEVNPRFLSRNSRSTTERGDSVISVNSVYRVGNEISA